MTSAQTTDDHDPAGSEELGLRELKKRQTRMAMHRAALELVVEHGLSAVTAQMIAERAGVSTRTFFNHWVTKESAILGINGGEGAQAIASLREKLLVMPAREAMRSMMREAIANVPVDRGLRELPAYGLRLAGLDGVCVVLAPEVKCWWPTDDAERRAPHRG